MDYHTAYSLLTMKLRLERINIDVEEDESFHGRLNRGLAPWKSMSFSCGGWLQFYMFGVARAVQMRGLEKGVEYLGCSAGALTAVGLAIDGDFDAAVQFCKNECLPKAYRDITGLFRLSEYVGGCVDKHVLPYFDNLSSDSLHISVTDLSTLRRNRVSNFSSREDLKQCLLASSAAFPFAPLVNFRGRTCIDGGIADFQPTLDKDTLTVSPLFFSKCDIKPSRYVPLWWSFLPPKSPDAIDWLYNLGFEDANRYFDGLGIPPTTPNAKLDMGPIAKNDHPFDEPRQITIHRFFGYELGALSSFRLVTYVLDFFLMIQVMLIWKPLALILIYIELVIGLFLYSTLGSVVDICRSLVSLWKGFWAPLLYLFRRKSGISNGKRFRKRARDDYCMTKALKILQCLFHPSWLQVMISLKPTARHLAKHQQLSEFSALYRFFCFFI